MIGSDTHLFHETIYVFFSGSSQLHLLTQQLLESGADTLSCLLDHALFLF